MKVVFFNLGAPNLLVLQIQSISPSFSILFQQIQIKKRHAKSGDASACVHLFFDQRRYIFIAGEGLQRFCIEHKIKLSKACSFTHFSPRGLITFFLLGFAQKLLVTCLVCVSLDLFPDFRGSLREWPGLVVVVREPCIWCSFIIMHLLAIGIPCNVFF